MKKFWILSMLNCCAMLCSCQKQDSAAEQQLAQQKAELDARDKALDERLNSLDERVSSLDERVKALAENEKASGNVGTIPSDVQNQTPDPAQVQAERERTIQQLSTEMRARISDDLNMKAERDKAKRRALEDLRSQRQPGQPESKMPGALLPAPEAASPTPSPAVEASSPPSSPESE
jgi:DNA repair exonuclease SbcCD ATPase subunit